MKDQLRSAVVVGNSIAGNIWATHPASTFQAQFTRLARERGIGLQSFPVKWLPASSANNMVALDSLMRGGAADLIFFQGAFEQAGGTHASALSAACNGTQQSLSLNATYSYGQVARLGTDTDFEWVQILTTNGSQVRRGLFGTRARPWPSGTPILTNSDLSNWSSGCNLWRAYVRAAAEWILGQSDRQGLPILLLHDWWFSGSASVTAGMKALVADLQSRYPNVGFVEFIKDDGTRIASDPNCAGPTASITAVSAGAGTPAELTITCNNEKGVRHLRAGRYVALWDVSASNPPTSAAAWEWVKVGTVDYDAKTFVVPTANRQQLGSATALTALGAGDVVAAYAQSCAQPRARIDTIGAVNNLIGAYDSHPLDEGFYWMAKRALEAVLGCLERMR